MTRKVWYVFQGGESSERFDLLIGQTGIRSENQINALRDHLVRGMSLEDACSYRDIKNKSNLERDLLKVNEIAEFVVKIEDLDWVRYNVTRKEK
jgi:hypothetical protein